MSRNVSTWRSGRTSRCVSACGLMSRIGDEPVRLRDVVALADELAEETVVRQREDALLRHRGAADADELADGRVDEPGRVVGAVPAARPIDEDDVVAADLRRPARPARLVRERPQPGAALLLHLGRDGVVGRRARSRAGRVREDVHLRQPGGANRLEGALERGVVLRREADDHVGGEVEVAERLELAQVRLDRVAARHRLEDAVVAGLERHVQVRADDRRLAQRGDEVVVDVVDLDRGEAEPLDARRSRPRRGSGLRASSRRRGRGSSRD